MKKILISCLIICATVFLSAPVLEAAGKIPEKNDVFPDINLPAPVKNYEKDYLGIPEKGSFSLSHIKADIVIVEIFSMYCPYCQKDAPGVNELFGLISENPDIKEKIKLIGIGAGNTPFEVDVFRKQYDILFPLFPDESFSIYNAVGEVRTPYFFVIRINPGGSSTVVYSRGGSIRDPDNFLQSILQESGL
jgi:peroxiredoxin